MVRREALRRISSCKVTRVDLYSAVLTTAPFILLAVSRGLAFGPPPVVARHRAKGEARWWIANDLTASASVVCGAVVSLLVLGGVVEPSGTTAGVAVFTGVLSLILLAAHAFGEILDRYVGPSMSAEQPSPTAE